MNADEVGRFARPGIGGRLREASSYGENCEREIVANEFWELRGWWPGVDTLENVDGGQVGNLPHWFWLLSVRYSKGGVACDRRRTVRAAVAAVHR